MNRLATCGVDVYTQGSLFCLKNGRNFDTGYHVDEPWNITLSEITPSQKDRYCTIPLICGISGKKIAILKQNHRYRSVVAPGGKGERNGGHCARQMGTSLWVAITE